MSQVIYIFGEFFTSTAVSNPGLGPWSNPGGGATEVASRLAKQCRGAGSGDIFWVSIVMGVSPNGWFMSWKSLLK